MAAEDELAIPEIPEAKPEDPEDVSWALSTAEAMWARGDNLEGIKWVRKAAEAASDAEDDERALELAKAASELTTLIARRSRASFGDGPGLAGGAPPDFLAVTTSGSSAPSAHSPSHPPSQAPPTSTPPSVPPATSRMGNAPALPPQAHARSSPPPAPTSSAPSAAARTTPSRPPAAAKPAPAMPSRSVPPGPIPLPSKSGAAPKAPQAPQAPAPVGAARGAPRPLATGPQPAKGGPANRVAETTAKSAVKGRRRSRENLDAEALAAGLLDTAPQPAVDGPAADRALGLAAGNDMSDVTDGGGGAVEMPVANARVKRRSRPEPDPTVVARLDDLAAATRERHERAEHRRSAAEWDASPTQNLTGEEMDHMNEGDRKTAFAIPISSVDPVPASAPVLVARPSAAAIHDPQIQTSQAVRVVVWRDGTGVHVAPAGTVVSSITIDAVLVVLEPSADLTAWLSQRER